MAKLLAAIEFQKTLPLLRTYWNFYAKAQKEALPRPRVVIMIDVASVGKDGDISDCSKIRKQYSITRTDQDRAMMKGITTTINATGGKSGDACCERKRRKSLPSSLILKPQQSLGGKSERRLLRTRQAQALSHGMGEPVTGRRRSFGTTKTGNHTRGGQECMSSLSQEDSRIYDDNRDAIHSFLEDGSGHSAVVLNHSGTIIGVNEHTVQTFGYSSSKELEGESVLMLLSRRVDKTYFRGILLQEMRETSTYYMSIKVGHKRRFCSKRKDGSEFLVSLATQKIYGTPFWVSYLTKESDIDERNNAT